MTDKQTISKKEYPIFDKYVKKWVSRKFLGVIAATFYFSIKLLGEDNWVLILMTWMLIEGTVKVSTQITKIICDYLNNR